MANQLTKDLEILFDNAVIGFDSANTISKQVTPFTPDQQSMQRAGDVVYRPQDYHVDVAAGLDVSGATPTDLIQRQVPAVYQSPNNVVFSLDAKEMRDPQHMQRMGEAAGKRLAAQIDSDLASKAALRAANVVKSTTAMSWNTGALAEAILIAKGAPAGVDRKLVLNPFDYKDVAGELGGRQYYQGKTADAYEDTRLPDLAGFKTFRADVMPTLAAIGTVTGTTVSVTSAFVPTAMTADVPTDNRQFTLVVAGANIANIKNGDAFTVGSAGTAVNSVHMITKADTGNLQTFRVISGAGTANLVCYPAPVATGAYQNVTQVLASGAAITFLNTVAKSTNVAWCDGAIELMAGRLAFPTDQGAMVATTTTANGIPLIFSAAFNHLTAKTTVRYTTLYSATILQPELCVLILNNQT
jgi:hypothetical protein